MRLPSAPYALFKSLEKDGLEIFPGMAGPMGSLLPVFLNSIDFIRIGSSEGGL